MKKTTLKKIPFALLFGFKQKVRHKY